jgi:DNA-binding NarL/FixJ family response regulator
MPDTENECGPKEDGRHAPAAAHLLKIAVVDDHPIFREGVCATLRNSGLFEVVGQGQSCEDAIHLAENFLPDLMLLDLRMPGDGMTAIRSISRSCPAVKIVVLTAFDDEANVTRSLHAGASGYLLKGASAAELVETLTTIADGGSYVSPGLAARLLAKRRPETQSPANLALFLSLTAREEHILRGVTEGLSNREIGARLGLSEKSIKHYMTNILQKLHARNRVEAAMLARQRFGMPAGWN